MALRSRAGTDTRNPFDLYLMGADSGEVRRVLLPEGGVSSISWSPDGTAMVIAANNLHEFGESPPWEALYLLRLEEMELAPLLDDASSPVWSPDGLHVAAISGDDLVLIDVSDQASQ